MRYVNPSSFTLSSQGVAKASRGRVSMKDELFEELAASVRAEGYSARGNCAFTHICNGRTKPQAHSRQLSTIAECVCRLARYQRQNTAELRAGPPDAGRPGLHIIAGRGQDPDVAWDMVRPVTRQTIARKTKKLGRVA